MKGPSDWQDASGEDALYCGHTMDAFEVEALEAGRFPSTGDPSVPRQKGTGSRHAGKPVQRWAWLVIRFGAVEAIEIAHNPRRLGQERQKAVARAVRGGEE